MAKTYNELKNIPLRQINSQHNRHYKSDGKGTVYTQHQTLSITDVLSEGPIEGIVGGLAGIQLNKNPLGNTVGGAGTDVTTRLINAPEADSMGNPLREVAIDNTNNLITAKWFRSIHVDYGDPYWDNFNDSTDEGEYYALLKDMDKQTDVAISASSGKLILNSLPDSYVSHSSLEALDATIDYSKYIPITLNTCQRGLDGTNELTCIYQQGKIIKNSNGDKEFIPGYFSLQGFQQDIPRWWKDGITHIDNVRRGCVARIKSITKTSDYVTSNSRHPQWNFVFFKPSHNVGISSGFDVRIQWNYLGRFDRARTFAQEAQALTGTGGTSVQFRPGTLEQSAMNSVGDAGVGSTARTNKNVSQQLKESNNFGGSTPPTVLVASSSNGFNLSSSQIKAADFVKLIINYPSGLYTVHEEDGDVEPAAQRYRFGVSVKRPGESNFTSFFYYTSKLEGRFRIHVAKTKNGVSFQETINLEPFRPFTDFRVQIDRVDSETGKGIPGWRPGRPDSEFSNISTAVLESVTTIMQEKLTYPYTAYAKIDFPASEFPQLPIRHYDCKGLKVKVPSNYVTRDEAGGPAEYTRSPTTGDRTAVLQDWDGTFRGDLVYTDNPVWIFYDIIVNKRYGLGDFLSEADIDIYSLYRIAKYCDEEVDDLSGNGTTEPRYTSNLYITKAVEAYKIMKDMATTFISMLYFLDGKMTLVADLPAGPTYLFNKANVVEGMFSYESTGSKTVANQVLVKWNNPDNNYRQENLIIEDRENIAKTGKIIPLEVFAFGCTRKSQAIRYGRWKLYTSINQTELVSFQTGIAGNYICPGDIVSIQDSDRSATRYGGRISTSSTTTSINIDSPVSINNGSDYTLSVVTIEPGAYTQSDVTINGVEYKKGDLVLEAFIDTDGDSTLSLCTLRTASSASNAYSADSFSSQNALNLTWKDTHRVETKSITNSAGNTSVLTTASSFSVAPTHEAMWVLNETVNSIEVASGGREYKVLSVAEGESNIYSITAAEYDIEKYNAVEDSTFDLGVPDPLTPLTRPTDVVPPLRGLSADIITYIAGEGGALIDISWIAPAGGTRKVRQPDGSLQDIEVDGTIYREYDGVEITHNLYGSLEIIRVSRSEHGIRLGPIKDGEFLISVKVIRDDEATSIPLSVPLSIDFSHGGRVQRFGGIPVGGISDTAVKLVDDGGTNYIEFLKNNYTISPVSYNGSDIVNACTVETAYRQELASSFPPVNSSRPADASGRWYDEDYYVAVDANDGVDRLKILKWHDDINGGTSSNARNWVDVGTGATTSFCTQLTGTITKAANSSEVRGTGTSFCSEVLSGMDIKIIYPSTGQTIVGNVRYIESDTVMYLGGANTDNYITQPFYTNNFLRDGQNDIIIGRLYNTGSGPVFKSTLALDGNTEASGISYVSGSSIESLQPNETGSDNSACQLNTGLTISKSSGGITFSSHGTVKSSGKDSASSSAEGFFLGYDHTIDNYTFGVGDSTDFVRWNGTDLEITGKVTAKAGGAIGGWQITDTGIFGGDITSGSAQALASGFVESLSASEGALVLHNQGSIHSKNFFINSDGSAKFRGSISAATGTFFGGLLPNAVDSTELNSGAVGTEELATGSIDGQHISKSALLAVYETAVGGSVVQSSYAALDGQHEKFRIYAGNTSAASAPFRVTKAGQVVANNLQLFDSNDQLYFDSSTGGFTPSALAQIASALSARVFNFAEIWTGNLDASDSTTFEEIALTESTNVTSKLRIPVNKLSATVSEEYFGLTNNPTSTTINVLTSAGTTIGLTNVINPDSGLAIGRSLKAGEILRVDLLNVPSGTTLTGVSNATNPETGTSFASTTEVEGPTSSTNIYFKMTAVGTFAATINVPGASAITFSIAVIAKPNTLQAAKDKIPSSFSFKLDRNTASANGTTVNVLANQTYTRVLDSTPGVTSYNVKTVATDGLGYGFITSSVEIQLGQGAVDAQGYITREVTETSLAANSYYYNSTLSTTGGDAEHSPSTRLFEVSVPTTSSGFVIDGNAATQASQNTSVNTLDLSGNVTGSDGMTITPGTSGGTVVIDGNLTVNGTQTTTSTNSLQIADKCILVAANAANAAAVNSAGLYVDRTEFDTTNPSFAWQTSDSAFVASNKLKAAQFKSTGDGSNTSPAYIFGARGNTGLYAEDAAAGDRVVISTHDGSSYKATTFDSLGITSAKDILVPDGGVFKSTGSNWIATASQDSYDFQFKNATGTNLFFIDSGSRNIGINTDQPSALLHIKTSTSNFSSVSADANELILESSGNTGMSIFSGSTAYGSILWGDNNKNDDGEIRFAHLSQTMQFLCNNKIKLEMNSSSMTIHDDGATPTASGLGYAFSALDLFNSHTNIASGEGNGITFSTRTNDSTHRLTRAAIKAGPSEDGKGYGFINIGVNDSINEDEDQVVGGGLQIKSTKDGGKRYLFGHPLGTSQQPTTFVEFNKTDGSNTTDAIVSIDQNNNSNQVGTKAGVQFIVGTSSGLINCYNSTSSTTNLEFRASTGTGPSNSNLFIEGVSANVGINTNTPKAKLHVETLGIESTVIGTVTTQAETVIATVSATDFRSGKFMIQMEDISNNNYLIAEILFVYHSSGQSVSATEYGVVFTGADKGVSFATTYNTNTGNIELKATCSANSANRKFTTAKFALSKNT